MLVPRQLLVSPLEEEKTLKYQGSLRQIEQSTSAVESRRLVSVPRTAFAETIAETFAAYLQR